MLRLPGPINNVIGQQVRVFSLEKGHVLSIHAMLDNDSNSAQTILKKVPQIAFKRRKSGVRIAPSLSFFS
jgi:hypothetical protein